MPSERVSAQYKVKPARTDLTATTAKPIVCICRCGLKLTTSTSKSHFGYAVYDLAFTDGRDCLGSNCRIACATKMSDAATAGRSSTPPSPHLRAARMRVGPADESGTRTAPSCPRSAARLRSAASLRTPAAVSNTPVGGRGLMRLRPFSRGWRSSCAACGAWAGSPPGNRGSAGRHPANIPGDSPRPATTGPAVRST